MKLEDLKWAVGQLAHAFRDPAKCDCPAHRQISYPQQDAASETTTAPRPAFTCEESTTPS